MFIHSHRFRSNMTTLFVENITVMDFSYLHSERGLLGESWIVDIELTGDLDQEGVIFDFSLAKKAIKNVIDTEFDHKLVIPTKSKLLTLNTLNHQTSITFTDLSSKKLEYTAPESAYCFLNSEDVSKEATILFLKEKLANVLPNNILEINIHLYTETIDGDFYHYSHGLKKHYGNCQRMAHGHRSRIQIFENSERNRTLESIWAKRWTDIYIGTEEDLQETFTKENITFYRFEYLTNTGTYSLIIEKNVCEIITTDSTVEFLAEHIANDLKEKNPRTSYKVIAFEGIKKGAIALR